MTVDTKIPAYPAKEDRKKKPDKQEYEKKIDLLIAEADHKKELIRTFNKDKREILQGGKIEGEKMTFQQHLDTEFKKLKQLKDQKREMLNKINHCKKQFEDWNEQKKELLLLIKPCKNLDELDSRVKELEDQYKNGS